VRTNAGTFSLLYSYTVLYVARQSYSTVCDVEADLSKQCVFFSLHQTAIHGDCETDDGRECADVIV
jgi:hypothetical protein